MPSARHPVRAAPRSTVALLVLSLGALGACEEPGRPLRSGARGAVARSDAGDGGLPEAETGSRADAGPGSPGPTDPPLECVVPDVPIPETAACGRGEPYPGCRHQVPDPSAAGGLYAVWRNTTPEHRWGRPALVSLVLASAREYARLHPGELVTLGDLDAGGPRHRTHRHGVDVDLYLPGLMATENRGSQDYPSNYEGRPEPEVASKRARVLDLARILATCARGALRIYYNDPEVVEGYGRWFERAGLESPFRRPMEPHNLLHLFHFHVTIARSMEPLPRIGDRPLRDGGPDGGPGAGADGAPPSLPAVARSAAPP